MRPLLIVLALCILALCCLPAGALASDASIPEATVTVAWWAPVALSAAINGVVLVIAYLWRDGQRRALDAQVAAASELRRALEKAEKDLGDLTKRLQETRETYATKSELMAVVTRMDAMEGRISTRMESDRKAMEGRIGKLEVGMASVERMLVQLVDEFSARR